MSGISLPEQRVTICKTIDFWLKVGISAGTCTAILLTVLTCYFWKKNQKYTMMGVLEIGDGLGWITEPEGHVRG